MRFPALHQRAQVVEGCPGREDQAAEMPTTLERFALVVLQERHEGLPMGEDIRPEDVVLCGG